MKSNKTSFQLNTLTHNNGHISEFRPAKAIFSTGFVLITLPTKPFLSNTQINILGLSQSKMESPSGAHHEDLEPLATPSKSGSDDFIPSKRSGNEENVENGMQHTNDRQMKRIKTISTSIEQQSSAVVEEREDQESYSCGSNFANPITSDSASEVSSSSSAIPYTRPLLHAQRYKTPQKAAVRAPGRATGSASSAAASVLVQRLVVNKHPQGPKTAGAFTPVRGKVKIKKTEVQATNDGYASVAKLSAWLADDPTSTKKVRHVRKGKNVIAKSRQFEEDMEDVIIEQAQISKGAVSDRKNWLKGAFHGGKEETEFVPPPPRYARSEVGGYRTAPTRKKSTDNVPRCQIVTDDAAASLSVSDKKDWLKNAFKSSGTTPVKNLSMPSKARSDIMHCRGEGRDDISALAKKKWSERSARKLAEKKIVDEIASPHPARTAATHRDQGMGTPTRTATTLNEQRVGPPRSPVRATVIPVQAAPAPINPVSGNSEETNHTGTTAAVTVDEDTTDVGFAEARKLLITKSKMNGIELKVISKVQRRKEKFEKMEQELRRRSGPKGLLRPSWGSATPSKGKPLDSYTKSYVEDIAPKRSFEELP
jgi:hypothetical protein